MLRRENWRVKIAMDLREDLISYFLEPFVYAIHK